MQGLSLKNSVEIVKGYNYYLDRLERLLFIEKEEIPGRFQDGSVVMDYFWREATPESVRELIFEIKRLIYKYEPDLNIKAVSAGFLPLESGQILLLIEIECFLKNNIEKVEVFSFTKIKNVAAAV